MFTHRSVTQTVPPASPVITLLEAKQQLRLETTEDDGLIENYIAVATAYCEHYTQRAFSAAQHTAYFSQATKCVRLPFPPALPDPPPLVEVKDDNGDWQVVDPAAYFYDHQSQPASICFCELSLPCSLSCNGDSVLRISWWAGYGEGSVAVPLLVKQAVLLLTAHYYERRLASDSFSTTEIPFGVTVLLDSVRWRFYA